MKRFVWILLISSAWAQYVRPSFNPGTTAATLTYVGSGSNNCHNVTTCAVTYSPTNGNLVIVDIVEVNTTAASPPTLTTDNGSSTWANRFASGQDPGGNFYFNEDSTLSAAGSATTITAHLAAATASSQVTVTEYHRNIGSWNFNTASSALLVQGTASTSQTCNGTGSVTPSSGVPVVITGVFYTATGQDAFTTNGSWLLRSTSNDIYAGDAVGVVSQIIASASGSYSAAASNGSSVTYECYATVHK